MEYNLEVLFDWPLIWNQSTSVDNVKMIVMNTKVVTYNAEELFINPEPFPFDIMFASSGGALLPYFMLDFMNGTLKIQSMSMTDIGVYSLEVIGIDDAGWLTPIPFNVFINRKFASIP